MKVAELKEKLIELGHDEAKINTMKKSELEELYNNTDDELDNSYSLKDLETLSEELPVYGDENWDSYVMGKFKPSEMVDGNPNVAGLRRVAELLLGDIVDSGPLDVKSNLNALTEVGRAQSVYSVTFNWKVTEGSTTRTFRAAADSFVGNTDKKFAIYPVAMADTRAEARALKRALLIETVCSDETSNIDVDLVVQHSQKHLGETNGEFNESKKISSHQSSFIKKKCETLGIDVEKFINSGENEYNNIDEVNSQTAARMIEIINDFQRDKDKIPTSIKKG